MDAAFLGPPSYLDPIVVQNRRLIVTPLVFPRCLRVSRGCTLQDNENMYELWRYPQYVTTEILDLNT